MHPNQRWPLRHIRCTLAMLPTRRQTLRRLQSDQMRRSTLHHDKPSLIVDCIQHRALAQTLHGHSQAGSVRITDGRERRLMRTTEEYSSWMRLFVDFHTLPTTSSVHTPILCSASPRHCCLQSSCQTLSMADERVMYSVASATPGAFHRHDTSPWIALRHVLLRQHALHNSDTMPRTF